VLASVQRDLKKEQCFMDVMALIIAVVLIIVLIRGSQPRFPRRSSRSRAYLWLYVRCIFNMWLLSGIVGIIVLHDGIPFSSLGLLFPDPWWPTLLALIVVSILCSVGMVFYLRSIKEVQDMPAWVKRLALPRSPSERLVWVAVSIHAGVCEEIIYRGFLPWYLSHHVSLFGFTLPYIGAAIISLILFSLGHLYQGRVGALVAGFMGIILALLYALTGNLFASVVLHILFDVRFSFGTPTSEGQASSVEETKDHKREEDKQEAATQPSIPLNNTPQSSSRLRQRHQHRRPQRDKAIQRIPYYANRFPSYQGARTARQQRSDAMWKKVRR
jgi:membrane protease YdiL (CAAX protease family)